MKKFIEGIEVIWELEKGLGKEEKIPQLIVTDPQDCDKYGVVYEEDLENLEDNYRRDSINKELDRFWQRLVFYKKDIGNWEDSYRGSIKKEWDRRFNNGEDVNRERVSRELKQEFLDRNLTVQKFWPTCKVCMGGRGSFRRWMFFRIDAKNPMLAHPLTGDEAKELIGINLFNE